MTTPITKAQLEAELRISFAGTYTAQYFTDLIAYCQAALEEATNRTSFTGSSAYLAQKAQIASAMEWISMFDHTLFTSYINSISENGASISFSSEVGLSSYKSLFERLVAKLRIPSTSNYNLVIADLDGTHLETEGSILY